jgi:hypothetical protein
LKCVRRHPGQRLASALPNTRSSRVLAKNIRLSSYLANPLSKSQHQRVDGDGCVGSYLSAARQRLEPEVYRRRPNSRGEPRRHASRPLRLPLRRYRRPLLLRLEHTHRPTLEDYVHRATRLGSSRSLNLRIGITGQFANMSTAPTIQRQSQLIYAACGATRRTAINVGRKRLVLNRSSLTCAASNMGS